MTLVPSLALAILDGFGERAEPATPTRSASPGRRTSTPLGALPAHPLSAPAAPTSASPGQMGNSEVGHLNFGAGRIVMLDITRIDVAVADGSFFENPALLAACEHARNSGRGRLHLLGLVSDGGVHCRSSTSSRSSSSPHTRSVPRRRPRLPRRPRHPAQHSARGYLAELERWLRRGRASSAPSPAATTRWTATTAGTASSRPTRHRPRRGERAGQRRARPSRASYARGKTDEFVEPVRHRRLRRRRRPDRRRRQRHSLQLPPRPRARAHPRPRPAGLRRASRARRAGARRCTRCMTAYDATLDLPVAFPEGELDDILGERSPAPGRASSARRDREVRPRHLLLQRRARGSASTARSASSSPPRATSPPTTRSRR